MGRTVSNLFGLSEEIIRPAIQYHAANHFQRYQFFRNQLSRVKMIERKLVCFLLCEQLNCKFPLGEVSCSDGVKHIAAVEVLISTGNLHGFVPDCRLQTELGTPVEFN